MQLPVLFLQFGLKVLKENHSLNAQKVKTKYCPAPLLPREKGLGDEVFTVLNYRKVHGNFNSDR